jgi:hypothetical protein
MERPDFFNINPDIKPEESLEQRLEKERLAWNQKTIDMSKRIKRFVELPELMVDLYTERQIALEYYHYLMSKMIILNQKFNKDNAERYDYYTTKSPIRYPNETTKNNKILVDLGDQIVMREQILNHSKFILEIKNTIDHLIWGVQKRIEVEKMLKGD